MKRLFRYVDVVGLAGLLLIGGAGLPLLLAVAWAGSCLYLHFRYAC